jgi:hypothetical protein
MVRKDVSFSHCPLVDIYTVLTSEELSSIETSELKKKLFFSDPIQKQGL